MRLPYTCENNSLKLNFVLNEVENCYCLNASKFHNVFYVMTSLHITLAVNSFGCNFQVRTIFVISPFTKSVTQKHTVGRFQMRASGK